MKTQLFSTVHRLPFVYMVILMVVLLSPGLLLADEANESTGEYSDAAPQACLNCHGETSALPAHEMLQTAMARSGDADTPFGPENHACESCHGPSMEHVMAQGKVPPGFLFDNSSTTEQKNSTCLDCHSDQNRFHWSGTTHKLEGLACVDCHSVHKADDPVLSLETQPEVCYGCHKEQRAQFLRQSHHPVQAATGATSHTGLLTCTDCHNTHGSGGPSQLKRSTINETCYDCHAEKRGPFLWEHQPVREDCTNCHTPHGSNYPNLLVARTPWLCQQCHAAPFHPATAYSGDDVPPNGFDQRVVGKDCRNCHNQVHGSNHPSGIRSTR